MANDQDNLPQVLQLNLVVNRGLTIRSERELLRFARWALESKMAPKSYNEPYQVIGAIMAGLEVGLSPLQSLRGIAVIGNAPCIWGDCRKGLILASGQLTDYDEYFEGEDTGRDEDLVACCRMGRGVLNITKKFSWADAKRAGLLNKDTYRAYLKDMLMNRARWRAQSVLFADCLGGMAPAELPEYHKETLPVENENEGEEPVKTGKMAALVGRMTTPDGMRGVPNAPGDAQAPEATQLPPAAVKSYPAPAEAPDEPEYEPEPEYEDPPIDVHAEPQGREPGADDDRDGFPEEDAPAAPEQIENIKALKAKKGVSARAFASIMVDAGSVDAQVVNLTAAQAVEVIHALEKLKS